MVTKKPEVMLWAHVLQLDQVPYYAHLPADFISGFHYFPILIYLCPDSLTCFILL